jgi:hypothetical protein
VSTQQPALVASAALLVAWQAGPGAFALVMLLVAIIRWRYRREIAALPRANPQV